LQTNVPIDTEVNWLSTKTTEMNK